MKRDIRWLVLGRPRRGGQTRNFLKTPIQGMSCQLAVRAVVGYLLPDRVGEGPVCGSTPYTSFLLAPKYTAMRILTIQKAVERRVFSYVKVKREVIKYRWFVMSS